VVRRRSSVPDVRSLSMVIEVTRNITTNGKMASIMSPTRSKVLGTPGGRVSFS
jgi:hypothetical protein